MSPVYYICIYIFDFKYRHEMLQISMNVNSSQQFVVIHVKITTDHSPVAVLMAMNWSPMEELANVSREKYD